MISEFTAEERAALSENSQLVLAMWKRKTGATMAEADRLLSRPIAHGAPGGAGSAE